MVESSVSMGQGVIRSLDPGRAGIGLSDIRIPYRILPQTGLREAGVRTTPSLGLISSEGGDGCRFGLACYEFASQTPEIVAGNSILDVHLETTCDRSS